MLAIIQARLGSKRLPGKVLMKIKGKPLIRYLLERMERCKKLTDIIVAVPARDFMRIQRETANCSCSVIGVPGDENDVARRFRWVLTRPGQYQVLPKAFVRICADSPMLDPALVDMMIERFEAPENKGMLVTNTQPRTWPAGQCIEIIPTMGFIRGLRDETDFDREHVTPAFYRHCTFRNVTNPLGDFSSANMCVDTAEDFERIKNVIEHMDRPHWSYGWFDLMEMMQ